MNRNEMIQTKNAFCSHLQDFSAYIIIFKLRFFYCFESGLFSRKKAKGFSLLVTLPIDRVV